MSDVRTPFLELLHRGSERGGFETDDTLASLLPLFRQIAEAHDQGRVAPLQGTQALLVNEDSTVGIGATTFSLPLFNPAALDRLSRAHGTAVDVVGEQRHTSDLAEGRHEAQRLDIIAQAAQLARPAYVTGYRSWEHLAGHHDPTTDVFSLGMLLASLACGLDFTSESELEIFVSSRENLFTIKKRLHPVVARVVVQMTELNRHKRSQDLRQVISALENYRDQPVDLDLAAIKADTVGDRRRLIQENLRDRLFEITRRNRLLYFKPTLQTLNLTVSSVPLVLDVRNIRLDQLFLWHDGLAQDLSKAKPIPLGKYLRIEDAPYIPGVLDKIIAEARRDRAEFGFAQLRLVLCFLRWHNLKDEPNERIHSPLLLQPVEVAKRKGVRDVYVLTPTSTEAEVNPAVRHHLRTLYGISLPEFVDLEQTTLDEFHRDLQKQIQASEPGVVLEKIERPKIELIHARARQRLDQWKQRQRIRQPAPESSSPGEYSYEAGSFRPRGLQLFLDRIRPKPFPLGDLAGAPPRPRVPGWIGDTTPGGGPVLEAEREMYSLKDDGAGNPYHWAFDLCSITLGNFHYRKMTLVRDYSRLGEGGLESTAFDAVFSVEPKPADEGPLAALPLREQYPVIACDSAQAAAVARARSGRSFIIQGPPGTGKSQTITNLIADYVAQGGRVLFVCEKRAAIDVVFHRLRQQGLDELCCLIHDSQADKREFIQNLKQTYEQWLASPPDEEAEQLREKGLATIEHDLAALDRFSQAMQNTAPQAGIKTRRLFHRLVDLRASRPKLGPEDEEVLPDYQHWLIHGTLVERFRQSLEMLGHPPVFAEHPFRWLGPEVIRHPRPAEQLRQHLDSIDPRLDAIESSLEMSGLDEGLWDTLPEIGAILDFAHRISPLAQQSQLDLLNPQSELACAFQKKLAELRASAAELAIRRDSAKHWKEPLTASDAATALDAARRLEKSLFRFVQPAYWRLRRTIRSRYAFEQHAIEPTLTKALELLCASQAAEEKHNSLHRQFSASYGDLPAEELATLVAQAATPQASVLPVINGFRKHILSCEGAAELVQSLSEVRSRFIELNKLVAELLCDSGELDLTTLRHVLSGLRQQLRSLPDLLPLLTELVDAPEPVRFALRNSPIRLDQFEAGMAGKTLENLSRADLTLNRFDGRMLEAYRNRLEENQRAWLKSNASVIRARVRRQFREHVQLSSLPAAQLTEPEKVFKKSYASGRRELEHEFGKTMRYKSIRDLAASESGAVLRDLKPIWLMSPLSVSDTLPLDPDLFDAVIFDEASQIPVEEAVPAVYRARQVIVVGDEMQLPPTSFFSSARSDQELQDGTEAERVEIDLDADSFLAQSARNLTSTLLAWHYRSRYEHLISFSNAAFYSGNLFTIPDRHVASTAQAPLTVTDLSQVTGHTAALLERSISFHFMERGCYEQRRNTPEAVYIAHLVRELLSRDTKLSIGIVAFSEAQQSEIERALDDLGEDDKPFALSLEAEMNREENDQFCGLFVKNLENVQGDERDIIILSICYGYDREKRMLMNFGPINQRGGEKRLNVIFSRARHHMAVVSSIHHQDITNEYNDGANALRNFLKYAESVSRGDQASARSVLENLNPLSRRALAPLTSRDAVIEQLAEALRQRGHRLDLNVGQSRFRCDLAIASAEGRDYSLGVLVDTDAHYENGDLVDRYLTRPAVLKAFGWQVLLILTKDWLREPDAVIERIERRLRGNPVESAELPPPAVAEPAVAPPQQTSYALAGSNMTADPSARPSHRSKSQAEPSSFQRRLEFIDGSSKKFWEIAVRANEFTVRFGRIGTAGQAQTKTFATEAEAVRGAELLVATKLKKGYRPAEA